jgi:uncharacterized membrane protein
MASIRILLAGESWVSNSTHFKGWDFFSSTSFDTGIAYLQKALVGTGIDFTHLPNHLADVQFPNTSEGLAQFDVVILSDIGSNTLLLHPDTWLRGKPTPNRLRLLRDYSFAGIYGAARYHKTPIEDVLPVNIYPHDDRVEAPEGALPEVTHPDHPILAGIPMPWPALLGFNEIVVKPDAALLAKVGEYPLLAVRDVGQGRTLAWASDIGPHWCPETFATWEGYRRLWVQAVEWLAREN